MSDHVHDDCVQCLQKRVRTLEARVVELGELLVQRTDELERVLRLTCPTCQEARLDHSKGCDKHQVPASAGEVLDHPI